MPDVLLGSLAETLKEYLADDEAWTLLSWWCDVSAPRLRLEKGTRSLPWRAAQALIDVAQRRHSGMTLTYALGWRPFYGRRFIVTPDVLVPRLETEELVDHLIALARRTPSAVLIDCGTGSGCIPITASLEISWKAVHGWDVSAAALDVARKNAKALLPDNRVAFHHGDITKQVWGDWLASILCGLDDTDYCIISGNLPYIPTDGMADLDSDVLQEPHLALDGGLHGTAIMKPWLTQIMRAVENSGTFGRVLATLEGDPDNVADLTAWCRAHNLPIQWREDALGLLRFCDIAFPAPNHA